MAAALAFAVLALQPGPADAAGGSGKQPDGVPLSQIVEKIRGNTGGEAVSIKFRNGAYHILWRKPDGSLQRYTADASSGRISRR